MATGDSMTKPDPTETLCTRCGLCCDGSLFADVELTGRAEATGLEILGLVIEDGETRRPLLVQPCAALRERRCTIYPHRPKCCRTFECRLLREVRSGAVDVASAQSRIAETIAKITWVRERIAELGPVAEDLPLAEQCAEALAGEDGADPERNRKRIELQEAMAIVTKTIQRTFLADPSKRDTV